MKNILLYILVCAMLTFAFDKWLLWLEVSGKWATVFIGVNMAIPHSRYCPDCNSDSWFSEDDDTTLSSCNACGTWYYRTR
ncbi:hypothetical protein Dip510_001611 [Elusimicrobium posterum]